MDSARIDIESAFADCVVSFGGQALDRVLPPSRKVDNADFYFAPQGVIAELKILSQDTVATPDYVRQSSALYARWVKAGKAPRLPPGQNVFSTVDLPEECTRELLELLRDRMRSIVAKANKQIKLTARHLGVPNAPGLLLLANDGNYVMKPSVAFHLLARLLTRTTYRSIDALVFFTVNEPIATPDASKGALLWATPRIDARKKMPPGFLEELRAAWTTHYAKVAGERITWQVVRKPSMETVDRIDLENNPRAPGRRSDKSS